MRKDRCLFCTSTKCNRRIVTPDLGYDEVACIYHGVSLEDHADRHIANGKRRSHIQSTQRLSRGDPYPAKDLPQIGDEDDPELWIEHLAKFPPRYWSKAREGGRMVIKWRVDDYSRKPGVFPVDIELRAYLEYTSEDGVEFSPIPNGIYRPLSAGYKDDPVAIESVDDPAWVNAIAAAARQLEWEIGLYIMLCDIKVFGDVYRGNHANK